MRWRSVSLVGLVLGLLCTSAATAMAAARVAQDRSDLDRSLQTAAVAHATSVSRLLASGREAALIVAGSPAVRGALAAGAPGAADAETVLAALGTVVPGLEEACLTTTGGMPIARLVRGRPDTGLATAPRVDVAPLRQLPTGTETRQTAPYLSQATGALVVGTLARVRDAAGRTIGFARLEIAVGDVLATDDTQRDGVVLDVLDARAREAIASLGRPSTPGLTRHVADSLPTTPTSIGGRRVVRTPIDVAPGNVNRWLVAATAPAVSLPASIGTVPPLVFLVGVLVLVLTGVGIRRGSIADRRARIEAEQRSRMDPLTGLYNRRHAVEAITAEVSRAARDGSSPAVIVLDIDHFKQVNDVYGHQAGDLVIQEIARRIRSSVRDYDIVARWGGEEFAVLLPGTSSAADVRAASERIRQLVAFAPVRLTDARSLNVTVSIGGAMATDPASTAESVVEAADRALYAAKRRGRNQTVLFGDMSKEDIAAEEPESIRLAQGLALAVSVREASPDHHCEEVADIAARIARHLGFSDSIVMRCRLGGWVHDVGKLAIPDRIISKPTALDAEEREILHSHVTLGAEIIRRIAGVRDAAKAVLHHHERWDGSGYPDGLAGPDIPIEARIVACADAFSAITAGRPYQPPLDTAGAVEQLRRSAGRSLDPVVVEALAEIVSVDAETEDERAPAPVPA